MSTHATERGDAVALVAGNRVVTYRELDRRGNQVARGLRRLGVTPGSCVALAVRNAPEFFEVLVGAGRLGATVAPLSFRAARDEAAYLVADSAAAAVIAEEANRAVYQDVDGVVFRGGDYDDRFGGESGEPLDDQPGTTLAPFRYYTSGTTGRPKAVMRTGDLTRMAAVGQVIGESRIGPVSGPDEVHLVAGVLYHAAPSSSAARALSLGHRLVIQDGFDAEEALRLIERERVSWTQMAPIHLVRIVNLPDEVLNRYDLSSMKRLVHAGAPCPVDVKWKAIELFPPGTVYEYYGATEGYATECPEEDWIRYPGTVGRPMGGLRIRILDDDGHDLPPGAVGQVYVDHSPHFEYDGAPDKTAESWRGDAFSVGDMGYLNDDGFLFLTDRKSHMIISGGSNVYPAEVENVLFAHPAVNDVAVIGVPDDEWGEQVKAIVETRNEVTEAELVEFCRDRLAHYKCPKTVDFVDELPRDPNGKVRKATLREPYWVGRATQI
ncbi:MAG: AMP-binding protein [Microbacteriaceae bacterium]